MSRPTFKYSQPDMDSSDSISYVKVKNEVGKEE